jgi:cytochrome c oxidase assembly protein subunit 15
MHRLGAAVTGLTLLSLGLATVVMAKSPRLTRAGRYLVAAVLLQISIGIATVHFRFPLPLAILHNAGAALLVLTLLWLIRALWPASPVAMVPWRHGQHAK